MPFPSNLNVEILIADVMGLGSWAFGRCLVHKGAALTNGVSVLLKRDPTEVLSSFNGLKIGEICEWEEGPT